MTWDPDADLQPTSSDSKITIDTLCAHILGGWHLRQQAHEDLRRFHSTLLRLMCRELGVEWHDDLNALKASWHATSGSWRDADNVVRIRAVDFRQPTTEATVTPDVVRLPVILQSICESYSAIETPFDSYFEYHAEPQEQAILAAHLGGIDRATDELRKLWQKWLRDMLLLRWPGAASRTTTWERLAELGLGEWPDARAYF